jgi:hypothetical protein
MAARMRRLKNEGGAGRLDRGPVNFDFAIAAPVAQMGGASFETNKSIASEASTLTFLGARTSKTVNASQKFLHVFG